jgi:hypothetical protein
VNGVNGLTDVYVYVYVYGRANFEPGWTFEARNINPYTYTYT